MDRHPVVDPGVQTQNYHIVELRLGHRARHSVLRSTMAAYPCSSREMIGILVRIAFFGAVVWVVNGQAGFISIDCGMAGNSSYTDPITGLVYQPDAGFIDTGINYKISKSYLSNVSIPQTATLRSFPDGERNCYTINQVNQGDKYIIRAFFFYGNYDSQNSATEVSPLQFELHLGVNLWTILYITRSDDLFQLEIITVATADYFSVCLVNTGFGTPFISSLELRPIHSADVYQDVNQSVSLELLLYGRLDVGGSSDELIRYPDDTYDRIWWPYLLPFWLPISTSEIIQSRSGDGFQVPSIVMRTAVMPLDNYTSLNFYWDSDGGFVRPVYYIYIHFAEFDRLPSNETRLMDVFVNGQVLTRNFTPSYLLSTQLTFVGKLQSATQYNFSITKAAGSNLPPIFNAVEIFSTLSLPNLASDRRDVDAMMDLKKLYDMKIWQGDPCGPENFSWKGVQCTGSSSNPPRVTSLNLSSLRLSGNIPVALRNLEAIEYLDLSNNNFTGPIPKFLSGLPSLRMLNMSNNQLNGSIPAALTQKQADSLLELRTDNNPDLCPNGNKCMDDGKKKKKTLSTAVIIVVSVIAALLIVSAILVLLHRLRRRKTPSPPSPAAFVQAQPEEATAIEDQPLQQGNRKFTYLELKTITNNFERLLGKGGFGTVYHGRLRDGTEVAVKLRSRMSAQESGFHESPIGGSDSKTQTIKEFQAEALLLSRVHHRNLVSLIGYCKDDNYLGLVYEYMANGSLKDHLTVKTSTGRVLSWRERLQIAVDAAQGLEYLHKGCAPPIIHRDVKSSNILLSQNLEAKIADFGLSKAFLATDHTHVSTKAIIGTPGYMDPEYHNTFQLNEKSDVYSFGVVLLELITGLPAILRVPNMVHIIQWIHPSLARGDIIDVIDVELKGEYDTNSIWKVADIAMQCTMLIANERPTMTQVVIQVKESLQLEVGRKRAQNIYAEVPKQDQIDLAEMACIDMKTTTSGPAAR